MEEDFFESLMGDRDSKFIAATTAADVSMAAVHESMNYFIQMLILSMNKLSDSLGLGMNEVRIMLESELGFEGQLENYIAQLKASKELIDDLVISLEDEEF